MRTQPGHYRRGLMQHRSDADTMSLHWIDAMAMSQIVIWCIALAQWLFRIPWIDYPLIYGAVVAWGVRGRAGSSPLKLF